MATTLEELRTFLQDIAKKENYSSSNIDIKPINSGGANFTTDLYLVTISDASKPDINIFAKVASIHEDIREKNDFISMLYKTEDVFYSELVVHYERIYNKNQVPVQDRLLIPKCYGQISIPYKEIQFLDNLEVKGFKNFDRMKTFDWEYASAAVTQMAKFHALGLAHREEDLEVFENIVKRLINISVSFKLMVGQLVKMAAQFGLACCDDDQRPRLQKFFSSMEKLTDCVYNGMLDTTMLIHGDFRPSNLMHRENNGKLEIVLLDFQTLRMGHPLFELMRFIFSCSDAEFRRLHYERLMNHYFSQLTLALQQLNVNVEKVYPRKTFDAHLDEMKPIGLILGLSTVALVTVNEEDAPTIGDTTSVSNMKINELTRERILGIIDDFVRWGVL